MGDKSSKLPYDEKRSTFLRAARAGKLKEVQEYLNEGIDVNIANAVSLKVIFNVRIVWIEKSVTRVTEQHHQACRVMPNSDLE